MAWDDEISGVHRAIAASDSPRIGVLAGPGTGKTKYGLMRRVVRLLEQGIQPGRILLISFTRVAAADLRDKAADLEVAGVEDVRATTLHAYCFGLLQQDAVLGTTGRVPRILMDHEIDLMLRDLGGDYGNIYARRGLLEAFVAGWARQPADYAGNPMSEQERSFQQGIQQWLRQHRAMLIGEVVPEAYKYLLTTPRAEALSAFDHVIADEYQDLNALEQQLLELLAQSTSLCIAGDDDQSIYRVRHANPEGIRAYLERPDVEGFSIEVCGRCPTRILSVANSLISCSPGRAKEPLVALEGARAGKLAIVQWEHQDDEVDGVTAAIAQDISAERREPGDILVLTNWAALGVRIHARLAEIPIPSCTYFREQALRSDSAREALALLRLLVDAGDAPALRVLLGLGDATGRSAGYQRLVGFCEDSGIDVPTALNRLAAGEQLGVRVPALVDRFSRAVDRTKGMHDSPMPDLVDSLFPDGVDNVKDLRRIALDGLTVAETPEQLLGLLIEAITQEDVPQSPSFVRIMSLHKSKGLTSESVYVAGAVNGVLPTIRADSQDEHDAAFREGRRLLYVAMTRAASELTISSSRVVDLAAATARGIEYDRTTIRNRSGRLTVQTVASPYLAELGKDAPRAERGEDWLAGRG